MRTRCFFLAGFMVLCVAKTVSANIITFSQSDWPGGAVTISTFGAFSTGGGITNQASGGNPGSYVTVYADHSAVGAGGHYFIWTVVGVDAWVYDPSVSGAISSLDFSADVVWPNPSGASFLPFVAQGGNYYFGDDGVYGINGANWLNSARSGATQFNFGLLNTTTGFWNFSFHPDFSASGGPITFGYSLGTNNLANVCCLPSGTDFISYDNIIFTLHTPDTVPAVPEPTSILLLGIGLVGAGVLHWRQRRA